MNGVVIFYSTAMLYYFSTRVALLLCHDADYVQQVLDNDMHAAIEGLHFFDRGTLI